MKKIGAEGCEIEARDISYTIQTSGTTPHPFKIWSKDEEADQAEDRFASNASRVRHVLRNVTCRARPREILAIVGPSGAGKTTLLEILAGKLLPSSPSILVDGRPISKSDFNRLSGYVTQRDLLFPLLTVRETLLFSARLRLGHLQAAALGSRVDSLILELGLGHVAGSRVGAGDGKVRGISGGERRRVSIGVEVVHDPRILILDEPTSGLDSVSAAQAVGMLRAMAEGRGRTVVMSVHQPGLRIVEMFGSVMLLAEGEVLHCGSVDRLQESLREVGLEVPAQVNAVEFAIDSVDALRRRKRQQQRRCDSPADREQRRSEKDRCTLQQLFGDLNYKVADEESVTGSSGAFDLSCDHANSSLTETTILAHRFLKNVFRTRELFACRTIQMLVSGLVLGSIFFDLRYDLVGARERVGLFAFVLTFLLSCTTEALPIFIQEREILMKETSSGTYRISSYVIANALVFLPFLLILSVLFSAPLYWLAGLNPSPGAFLFFVLLIWLILYTANSVVACVSALVPNFVVGNSLIAGVMGSSFLFSGYFISKEAMPGYWVFMHYVSVFKYPFEGLLVNEFGGKGRCLEGRLGACLLDGDGLLRLRGLGEERRWRDVAVMLGFVSALRFFSYVVLRLRCELDRRGGLKKTLV